MALPKQATGYTFTTELVDQSDTRLFKSTPTLAAGDWKVSKDQGAFANLGTLPTVTPSATRQVKIVLSAAEMTADDVGVEGVDAAGAEWCDVGFHFSLGVRNADDLAYPATTGRSISVSSAGGVTLADGVDHGGTTARLRLGSSGSDYALNITSSGDSAAVNIENTGTGDALDIVCDGTTGNAVFINSNATCLYIKGTGDNTPAVKMTSLGTSSPALELLAAIGLKVTGHESGLPAILVATASGGTDCILLTPGPNGNGISSFGGSNGKHSILLTGGGGGDGLHAVGGLSGRDINLAGSGDILGNLAGTINGLTSSAKSDVFNSALTESYAADGATFTLAQALYEICQFLEERSASGTTVTIKKRDGSTTAMTLTLNSGTQPTSQTRSS